jgi:hypothetical protein
MLVHTPHRTDRPLGARRCVTILLGLSLLLPAAWLPRKTLAETVQLVVAEDAPALEKLAAAELARQLTRLHGADVQLAAPGTAASADVRILLGSPETNAAVAEWREQWPEMSDQGHVIRAVGDRPSHFLLVGGNTPVATLWAVHEWGHHQGIRSFLFGDLDPIDPPPLGSEPLDIVIDPTPRRRGWTIWDDSPTGWEAWGLDDQRALIRQLAKHKINYLVLRPRPWQPFVDYAYQDQRKQSSQLGDGTEFIVSGDTAGRTAFRGATTFDNPEFAEAGDYDARLAAGRRLMEGIIEAAREHGMQVTMTLSPGIFAREFAESVSPALAAARSGPGFIPAAGLDPADQDLHQLARLHVEAYRETYPQVDDFELSLADLAHWPMPLDQVVQALAGQLTPEQQRSWRQRIDAAREGQDEAELEAWRVVALGLVLTGSWTGLDTAAAREASEADDLAVAGRNAVSYRLADVPAQILPQLEALGLPVQQWHFQFDWTRTTSAAAADDEPLAPSRPTGPAVEQTSEGQTSRGDIHWTADLPPAAARPSVLPELDHQRMVQRLERILAAGLAGYRIRGWEVGDLDLALYLVSRQASGQRLSCAEACRELLEPICGEGVPERVTAAMEEIQAASRLIAEGVSDLGEPRRDMLLRFMHEKRAEAESWAEIRDHYLSAMNEMYRANTRAREGGRIYTLYLARRFEFAFEYMNCLLALHEAAAADDADEEARMEALERGIESLYGGLNALSAVARSPSDLGIIAVLNAHGYRRLLETLDPQ